MLVVKELEFGAMQRRCKAAILDNRRLNCLPKLLFTAR